MLHPSYNELMDYVNENAAPQENGEPLVQSRYTLVMAAAKRARQIVDARSKVQTSYTAADKPLSVAVKELYSGEVRILGENEEPDAVLSEPDAEAQENSGDEAQAPADGAETDAEAEAEAEMSETPEEDSVAEDIAPAEVYFSEETAEDVLHEAAEAVSEEEEVVPEKEYVQDTSEETAAE